MGSDERALFAQASPGHQAPDSGQWDDRPPPVTSSGGLATRGDFRLSRWGDHAGDGTRRLCLAPRAHVGRWYELEMELNVPENSHVDLVLADAGLGQRVHIPFWTQQFKMRNRLVGPIAS